MKQPSIFILCVIAFANSAYASRTEKEIPSISTGLNTITIIGALPGNNILPMTFTIPESEGLHDNWDQYNAMQQKLELARYPEKDDVKMLLAKAYKIACSQKQVHSNTHEVIELLAKHYLQPTHYTMFHEEVDFGDWDKGCKEQDFLKKIETSKTCCAVYSTTQKAICNLRENLGNTPYNNIENQRRQCIIALKTFMQPLHDALYKKPEPGN
jgi:hypothetical protein